MPKEGALSHEHDHELEDVPGVLDGNGHHVKNYRKWWTFLFEPRPMPNLPERDFKFFRQPEGPGHVQ